MIAFGSRFNALISHQTLKVIRVSLFNRDYNNLSLNQTPNIYAIKRNESIKFDTKFDNNFGDTFGTLEESKKYQKLNSEYLADDEDGYDKLEVKRGPKMAFIGYYKLIRRLVNSKPIRLAEALEAFNRMTCEDRIPPEKSLYTILLKGCAKCGYTKKAFELLEEMLRYDLKPTKAAITSLLNACAESPFPEYGLEKANYMREYLYSMGYLANYQQYNAMIKAYGKLGDMKTAFEIVDEMIANGCSTTSETFAMLLMGCISDRQSGLYHAIRIVRKMKNNSVPFTIYIYNLLLRAIRDCGLSSENDFKSLVQECNYDNRRNTHRGEPISRIKDKNLALNQKFVNTLSQRTDFEVKQVKQNFKITRNELSNNFETNNKSLIVKRSQLPNILYPKNSFKEVLDINIESLNVPKNRLMLFGGMHGFLQMMRESNVEPTVSTFTLFLDSINIDERNLVELLKEMESYKIRFDTDFFNILIKKICLTTSAKDAENVLLLMQKKGLQPDIVTFGVLALGCRTLSMGKRLIGDIEKLGFRANIEIIGGLVLAATRFTDFNYLNYLIDYMRDHEINPSAITIELIEATKLKFQKMLSSYDRQQTQLPVKYTDSKFRESFAVFKRNHESWLQNVTIAREEHPWAQYKYEKSKGYHEMHEFEKFMRKKIARKIELCEQISNNNNK